jgi:hypothetical protein
MHQRRGSCCRSLGAALATGLSLLVTLGAPSLVLARGRVGEKLGTALTSGAGKDLTKGPRASATSAAQAGAIDAKRGVWCRSISKFELVRVVVFTPSSYRQKSSFAKASSALATDVSQAEKTVLRHRSARACATFAKTTSSVTTEHPVAAKAPIPTVEHEQPGVPTGQKPRHGDTLVGPGQLKATPSPDPFAAQDFAKRNVFATAAGDPVRVLQSTNFIPSSAGFPEENNAATGGGVVVYTGNDDAFFSVDDGLTFTELNPGTLFGPTDGSFCCDQVVRYAPSVDRFFWLLQGDQGYILAVSSPAQIEANAQAGNPPSMAWTTHPLTPRLFDDASSDFDFPDMAVGPTALWLDWNRVNVGKTLARLNLRQLATGCPCSINYWKLTGGATFDRLAQQPNAVEYLVSNDDGGDPGKATLHFVNEISPVLQTAEVTHVAVPSADYTSDLPPANPSNPGNWLYREGFTIGGATEASGQLWIAFNAGRTFPGTTVHRWSQPHVQIAVYRTNSPPGSQIEPSSFVVTQQIATANTAYAVAFPFLASDPDGDVAMSYSYGGPTLSPSAGAMVLSGPATGSIDVIRGGEVSPSAAVDRAQGDYSSVQPDGSRSRGFIAAGYAAQNDSDGPHDHWDFVRFGFGG